jgi:hypothetical protein
VHTPKNSKCEICLEDRGITCESGYSGGREIFQENNIVGTASQPIEQCPAFAGTKQPLEYWFKTEEVLEYKAATYDGNRVWFPLSLWHFISRHRSPDLLFDAIQPD